MPLEKMETISAPAVASHLNPGGLLHFGQGQVQTCSQSAQFTLPGHKLKLPSISKIRRGNHRRLSEVQKNVLRDGLGPTVL